jgi:hypothetical protein
MRFFKSREVPNYDWDNSQKRFFMMKSNFPQKSSSDTLHHHVITKSSLMQKKITQNWLFIAEIIPFLKKRLQPAQKYTKS